MGKRSQPRVSGGRPMLRGLAVLLVAAALGACLVEVSEAVREVSELADTKEVVELGEENPFKNHAIAAERGMIDSASAKQEKEVKFSHDSDDAISKFMKKTGQASQHSAHDIGSEISTIKSTTAKGEMPDRAIQLAKKDWEFAERLSMHDKHKNAPEFHISNGQDMAFVKQITGSLKDAAMRMMIKGAQKTLKSAEALTDAPEPKSRFKLSPPPKKTSTQKMHAAQKKAIKMRMTAAKATGMVHEKTLLDSQVAHYRAEIAIAKIHAHVAAAKSAMTEASVLQQEQNDFKRAKKKSMLAYKAMLMAKEKKKNAVKKAAVAVEYLRQRAAAKKKPVIPVKAPTKAMISVAKAANEGNSAKAVAALKKKYAKGYVAPKPSKSVVRAMKELAVKTGMKVSTMTGKAKASSVNNKKPSAKKATKAARTAIDKAQKSASEPEGSLAAKLAKVRDIQTGLQKKIADLSAKSAMRSVKKFHSTLKKTQEKEAKAAAAAKKKAAKEAAKAAKEK